MTTPHDVTTCGGVPVCGVCNQAACTEGYRGGGGGGGEQPVGLVSCPACGHEFDPLAPAMPPVRVTETAGVVEAAPEGGDVPGDPEGPLGGSAEAKDPGKAYGDVEYADPGYQADGKSRYPLDTQAHIRSAWSYINQDKNAAKYTGDQLKKIKAKVKAAAKKLGIQISEQAAEAMIDGELSHDDKRDLVRKALCDRIKAEGGGPYGYVWVFISDLTDSAVVYAGMDDVLYQCSYAIDAANVVTLGEPFQVVRTYAPDPAAAPDPSPMQPAGMDGMVETDRVAAPADARVIEAKGTTSDGGRIFRVRMIEAGDSKNGRRYPQPVLAAATTLYEGAKAYDRHRDLAELKSGTIQGLVGMYRSVEAADDGLDADLHLLPSATHAAEALDAALAGQADGLAGVIGLSHDVYATFKQVTEGGVRLQEATAITKVNSVDLVSDPAAGGKASRVIANNDPTHPGAEPATHKEDDVPPTKEDILGALAAATPEELATAGLARATAGDVTPPQAPGAAPGAAAAAAPAPAAEVVDGMPKTSFLGQMLIKAKLTAAGIPASATEKFVASLPDRITEADVDAAIAGVKSVLAMVEREALEPSVTVSVTREARDKKIAALDAFFGNRRREGYSSFREAWLDWTGYRPRAFGEDVNRRILADSFGTGFDSDYHRVEESLDSTSWAQVLGDSITRRMVGVYQEPNLQSWRQIVSSIVPVNDFRTQRIGRVGGYGTLPAVAEAGPYNPLTSPPDEEATYAVTKRGGTEDLTMEMIANDDVRAISNIPMKLGRAASQTLFRFVWDLLRTNAACTYDGVALFHASHANITTSALSQTTMTAARAAMRKQAAYGDSSEILDLTPRNLIVPAGLEEIAWTLANSVVSVGGVATDAELSRTAPNLHQGLNPIVLSYLTDQTDWFLSADPAVVPTIEIGFYLGREDPELFTQADANSGSMFAADKMTIKIRHPYNGTVLDHRGFYGGVGVA